MWEYYICLSFLYCVKKVNLLSQEIYTNFITLNYISLLIFTVFYTFFIFCVSFYFQEIKVSISRLYDHYQVNFWASNFLDKQNHINGLRLQYLSCENILQFKKMFQNRKICPSNIYLVHFNTTADSTTHVLNWIYVLNLFFWKQFFVKCITFIFLSYTSIKFLIIFKFRKVNI